MTIQTHLKLFQFKHTLHLLILQDTLNAFLYHLPSLTFHSWLVCGVQWCITLPHMCRLFVCICIS